MPGPRPASTSISQARPVPSAHRSPSSGAEVNEAVEGVAEALDGLFGPSGGMGFGSDIGEEEASATTVVAPLGHEPPPRK